MVLCDLPYGITQNKWDIVIPVEQLWEQYRRITKPNAAIVLTANQPFSSALVLSNPAWFRQALVWSKNKTTGHLNANRRPLSAHEDVLVFSRKAHKYNPQMLETGIPAKSKTRGRSSCYGSSADVKRVYVGGSTLRYPTSVLRFDAVTNHSTNECRVHPTQKPVALMEYLIRTYTNEGELVLDNCMGSGTTGVACVNTNRSFIGFEKDQRYFKIAHDRINAALDALSST